MPVNKTLADLQVNIGADAKNFFKEMAEVQKSLAKIIGITSNTINIDIKLNGLDTVISNLKTFSSEIDKISKKTTGLQDQFKPLTTEIDKIQRKIEKTAKEFGAIDKTIQKTAKTTATTKTAAKKTTAKTTTKTAAKKTTAKTTTRTAAETATSTAAEKPEKAAKTGIVEMASAASQIASAAKMADAIESSAAKASAIQKASSQAAKTAGIAKTVKSFVDTKDIEASISKLHDFGDAIAAAKTKQDKMAARAQLVDWWTKNFPDIKPSNRMLELAYEGDVRTWEQAIRRKTGVLSIGGADVTTTKWPNAFTFFDEETARAYEMMSRLRGPGYAAAYFATPFKSPFTAQIAQPLPDFSKMFERFDIYAEYAKGLPSIVARWRYDNPFYYPYDIFTNPVISKFRSNYSKPKRLYQYDKNKVDESYISSSFARFDRLGDTSEYIMSNMSAIPRALAKSLPYARQLNDVFAKIDKLGMAKYFYRARDTGYWIRGVGYRMTFGYSLADIGAIVYGLKVSADLQSKMLELQARANITDHETILLKQQALELGQKSIFTASDAAEAQIELAKQGYTTEQILAAMPAVTALAASENISLADSAYYVAASMRGFHMELSQTMDVVNMFAKTAGISAVQMKDIAHDFAFSAGSIRMAGWQMSQVLAMWAGAANVGAPVQYLGRYTRGLLDVFTSPTAAREFRKYGIRLETPSGDTRQLFDILEDFEKAQKRLPKKRFREMLENIPQTYREMLLQVLDTTYEVTDNLGNKTTLHGVAALRAMQSDIESGKKEGTAQAIAESKMKGLQGAIRQLTDSIVTLFNTIMAKGFLDNVTRLVNALQSVVVKLNQIVDANPKLANTAIGFGLITAAIGPLIILLGSIMVGLNQIVLFLTSVFNPVLKWVIVDMTTALAGGDSAIVAIGGALEGLAGPLAILLAVASAMVWLYATEEDFRSKTNEVFGDAIKTIQAWYNAAKPIIDSIIRVFSGIAQILASIIALIARSLVDRLGVVLAILRGDFADAWNHFRDLGADALYEIIMMVSGFADILDAVTGNVFHLGETARNYAKNIKKEAEEYRKEREKINELDNTDENKKNGKFEELLKHKLPGPSPNPTKPATKEPSTEPSINIPPPQKIPPLQATNKNTAKKGWFTWFPTTLLPIGKASAMSAGEIPGVTTLPSKPASSSPSWWEDLLSKASSVGSMVNNALQNSLNKLSQAADTTNYIMRMKYDAALEFLVRRTTKKWQLIQGITSKVWGIISDTVIKTISDMGLSMFGKIGWLFKALFGLGEGDKDEGVVPRILREFLFGREGYMDPKTGKWVPPKKGLKQYIEGLFTGDIFNFDSLYETLSKKIFGYTDENGVRHEGLLGSTPLSIPLDFVINFTGIFTNIRGFVDWVVSTITQGLGGVSGLVTGIINGIASSIQSVFGGLASFLGGVWNSIVSGASGAFGGLASFLGGVWNSIVSGASGAFGGLYNTITGIVSDIAGFINDHLVKPWNNLKISIPRITIPGIELPVPEAAKKILGSVIRTSPTTIGGQSYGLPSLPMFASGGIAMKPLIGLLGEAGPEAVLPLKKLPDLIVPEILNYIPPAPEQIWPVDRTPEYRVDTRKANIYVELDGRTIARSIGQPLVDEIRLRTGVRV